MAVRCGNHGRNAEVYHDTAAEVRACFAGQAEAVAKVAEAFPGSTVASEVHVVSLSPVAEDRAMKAAFAERERAQEEAAFMSDPDLFPAQPVVAPAPRPRNVRTSSAGQHQYIRDLARKLDSTTVDLVDLTVLTWDEASAMITQMDRMVKERRAAEREAGRREQSVDPSLPWLAKGTVHVIDGVYFRVHVGQGSGRPYAVRANVIVPAVWKDGRIVETGVVEWDRVPGAVTRLTAETVASAEEAAAFGRLAGRCCFCSFPIDTPESTLVGYGPVCADKFGLPWGATVSEGAAVEEAPTPAPPRGPGRNVGRSELVARFGSSCE